MLVYTTGCGVYGFTYEITLGEYYLSHPNVKIANEGTIYSINEGSYHSFPEYVRKYIEICREREYCARYIGSLVADFHRNMLRGGIYLYPSTRKAPSGKLRLMYECNALAFVIEQAGGRASDGQKRILEIQPESLHQRVPLIIGSKKMVTEVEELYVKDGMQLKSQWKEVL